MYVLYSLFSIGCFVQWSLGYEEKRLLLDDPAVLAKDLGLLTQRVSALEALVQNLQAENQNLKSATLTQKKALDLLQNSYGSTYVRWGRKGCPSNLTELVYSGYTVGDAHRKGGGAANLLCLPHEPILRNETRTSPNYNYLRGAEYESNYFGANTFNEDIPCAVCRSFGSSSVVMIPGRTSCYGRWQQEYSGNLASGHSTNPSEYVCIDENPEMVDGGAADNNNGRLYYPVKTNCGPLPCPPYQEGKYVACVVCSK